MAKYKLFFDGSCGPKNPGGTAAYGFALMKEGEETPVEHGSGVIGTGPDMTNNLAEFRALDEGLKSFLRHNPYTQRATVSVYGDSNLVVQIMNKHWRPKPEAAYFSAYVAANATLQSVRKAGNTVALDWIPRELNTICDDLSKAHQKAV